jgi:hypothetical protein
MPRHRTLVILSKTMRAEIDAVVGDQDSAATMQSPDADTRVISYTGAAKLNQVVSGSATPVTGSFPFAFLLTVQRVQ